MAALQQLRIHHRTGANDLGAARTDSGHLRSLFQRLARSCLRCVGSSRAARRLPSGLFRQVAATPPVRRPYRSGNHRPRAPPDAVLYARNLRATNSESRFSCPCVRIVLQEFAGEAHGAKRQAHRIAELSAPDSVSSQLPPPRSPAGRSSRLAAGGDERVNQSRFFQSGNDFDRPPRRRAYPFQKRARISSVAQRRVATTRTESVPHSWMRD